MLTIKSFQLTQAMSKLEAIFRDVLLSNKMGYCLGHTLLQDLQNQFMHYDFSVRSFQQGLKVTFIHLSGS